MTTRRALVTGGSGDIGGAIAHALAAQGCEVLVHANANPDRAQAIASDARIACEQVQQDAGIQPAAVADQHRSAIVPRHRLAQRGHGVDQLVVSYAP